MWLAEETTTGLPVAVRVVRTEAQEDLLRLMRGLTQRLLHLQSQHVVTYRSCLPAADGACAIITNYVPGEQLATVLANQPGCCLQWRSVSRSVCASGVILGVLKGLAALHSAEPTIMHLGVTPSKILINKQGNAVLTDLCLSYLTGDPACSSPPWNMQSSSAAESRRYMSPELAEGSTEVDARADVWAAGVVLHEMLSGGLLFPQVIVTYTLECTHMSTSTMSSPIPPLSPPEKQLLFPLAPALCSDSPPFH